LFAVGFKTLLKSTTFNLIISALWNCFKILEINQYLSTYEKFENNIQLFINLF
jgi:hypothetical protein